MLHWLQVSARLCRRPGKCFVWPLLGDDLCGTLDTVDNEHTEMAGAVIVMLLSAPRWFRQFRDILQICSITSAFIPGFYALLCLCRSLLWRESKVRNALAEVTESWGESYEYAYLFVAGAFWRKTSYLVENSDFTVTSFRYDSGVEGLKLQTVVDI